MCKTLAAFTAGGDIFSVNDLYMAEECHIWKQYAGIRAVPWLRRLVAGLSPRRPRFAPGSIR
jgi:hypothetical protein